MIVAFLTQSAFIRANSPKLFPLSKKYNRRDLESILNEQVAFEISNRDNYQKTIQKLPAIFLSINVE